MTNRTKQRNNKNRKDIKPSHKYAFLKKKIDNEII